jgi:hypothetical protein
VPKLEGSNSPELWERCVGAGQSRASRDAGTTVQGPSPLGTAASERLAADGWVLLTGAVSGAGIAAARQWLDRVATDPALLDRLQAQYDAPGVPRKLRRIFWADPSFWVSWIGRSGVRDALVALVGSSPALVFHAAFLKPAGVGGPVGFHQDQALWEATLPGAYSFWMPLDAADSTNGGIVVCPGSHRDGLLPHVPDADHPWHDVVDLKAAGLVPVPVASAPGDVVVWDRFLVHGSDANVSERSRRAMVLVFVPDTEQARAQATDYTSLAELDRLAGPAPRAR